jgi:hypothetical protein
LQKVVKTAINCDLGPRSDDLHPEITSPVLMSTTASLPPNLLRSIDDLRAQKTAKVHY